MRELSQRHGLDDYAVLYSTTEYKKVRLEYFSPAFDEWERRFVTPKTQEPARV